MTPITVGQKVCYVVTIPVCNAVLARMFDEPEGAREAVFRSLRSIDWDGGPMHHVDLFRHLLTVIDPRHLTHDDRIALINLVGACIAVERSKTLGGGGIPLSALPRSAAP